jgi:hypothetical protein
MLTKLSSSFIPEPLMRVLRRGGTAESGTRPKEGSSQIIITRSFVCFHSKHYDIHFRNFSGLKTLGWETFLSLFLQSTSKFLGFHI